MATYRRYLIKGGTNEPITVEVGAMVPLPKGCLLVASQTDDFRGVAPDDAKMGPWDLSAFVRLQDVAAFEGLNERIGLGTIRVTPFKQASKLVALLAWPSLFPEAAPKEFTFVFTSPLGPRQSVHAKIWVWAVPLTDLTTVVEVPGLYDMQAHLMVGGAK